MDPAAREQFKASAADWAEQLHINYNALFAAGFDHDDAMALLIGSFTQNAGVIQAQAVENMLGRMIDPETE